MTVERVIQSVNCMISTGHLKLKYSKFSFSILLVVSPGK